MSSMAYLAAVMTMVGSTALVMTMSPIIVANAPISILPPDIPLPVSPDLPENNYSESLELPTEPSQAKSLAESHDVETPKGVYCTDSIISQLLAVITLKNSFVQFLYALRDPPHKSGITQPSELQVSSTDCRILPYSDYRCYNVTTGEVVQRQLCCGECRCRMDTETNINFNQMNSKFCNGLACYGPGYDVMCCDRHRLVPRLSEGGYNFHPFPDLLTGFTTGSPWLTAAA